MEPKLGDMVVLLDAHGLSELVFVAQSHALGSEALLVMHLLRWLCFRRRTGDDAEADRPGA